jgi:hypothetical protein
MEKRLEGSGASQRNQWDGAQDVSGSFVVQEGAIREADV